MSSLPAFMIYLLMLATPAGTNPSERHAMHAAQGHVMAGDVPCSKRPPGRGNRKRRL
jgi:hypothetical protein